MHLVHGRMEIEMEIASDKYLYFTQPG